MTLKEQLLSDMKESMKTKDTERKNVIQIIKTEILYLEKSKQAEANNSSEGDMVGKADLDDSEVLSIIAKEVKKRLDVYSEYEKSGRQDLLETVDRQLEILRSYLPKQLTDEELNQVVVDTIAKLGATSMKDMGGVMKAVNVEVAGKADNGRISAIVKANLG